MNIIQHAGLWMAKINVNVISHVLVAQEQFAALTGQLIHINAPYSKNNALSRERSLSLKMDDAVVSSPVK